MEDNKTDSTLIAFNFRLNNSVPAEVRSEFTKLLLDEQFRLTRENRRVVTPDVKEREALLEQATKRVDQRKLEKKEEGSQPSSDFEPGSTT